MKKLIPLTTILIASLVLTGCVSDKDKGNKTEEEVTEETTKDKELQNENNDVDQKQDNQEQIIENNKIDLPDNINVADAETVKNILHTSVNALQNINSVVINIKTEDFTNPDVIINAKNHAIYENTELKDAFIDFSGTAKFFYIDGNINLYYNDGHGNLIDRSELVNAFPMDNFNSVKQYINDAQNIITNIDNSNLLSYSMVETDKLYILQLKNSKASSVTIEITIDKNTNLPTSYRFIENGISNTGIVFEKYNEITKEYILQEFYNK